MLRFFEQVRLSTSRIAFFIIFIVKNRIGRVCQRSVAVRLRPSERVVLNPVRHLRMHHRHVWLPHLRVRDLSPV